MKHSNKKASRYPKSHLLAASGVAALLSLALLVFPSREVEAKRTSLELELTPYQSAPDAADEQPLAAEPAPPEAPFAQIEPQGEESDTETAALPEEPQEQQDPRHKRVQVANGDTLSTVFAKVGLPSRTVHDVLASSKEAKQLSRLRIGQEIEFTLNEQGELAELHTRVSDLVTLKVSREGSSYSVQRDEAQPETRTTYAYGVIDSSLFLAAKRAGLGHDLTMNLANIFGYDIDFALDIRQGDTFELVYEEKVWEGKVVGSGQILSARFTNRGKTFTAVRYTNRQGVSSYYNADGESLRKAFIRTPVDFARISSGFSAGRKHPILNKIRAHKGVDYAAPHGTPIKSAGDGKVILAGRKGGYGNTVVIQHGSRYRTLYAHMQGFAKGIRNGSTVKQGQIIGYIGTTGLSTGPHLHYEFQVDGQHVDPLSQKLPMSDPIAKTEKPRFLEASRSLLARMDQEKTSRLALNER